MQLKKSQRDTHLFLTSEASDVKSGVALGGKVPQLTQRKEDKQC